MNNDPSQIISFSGFQNKLPTLPGEADLLSEALLWGDVHGAKGHRSAAATETTMTLHGPRSPNPPGSMALQHCSTNALRPGLCWMPTLLTGVPRWGSKSLAWLPCLESTSKQNAQRMAFHTGSCLSLTHYTRLLLSVTKTIPTQISSP